MNALAKLIPYMELEENYMLMNAFFSSQFNYCPVIWMFLSRALNNKRKRLHERCLHVIYNGKISNFKKLLEKDNSVYMHYRNVETLAIEIFNAAYDISHEIMNEMFLNLLSYLSIVFIMIASLYLLCDL